MTTTDTQSQSENVSSILEDMGDDQIQVTSKKWSPFPLLMKSCKIHLQE